MVQAELADAGLFGSMARYGDLCIHAVIDLRRAFGRAELEAALARTIRAFPVLGRRYEARFWRDRWVPVEAPLSEAVHCSEDPGDLEAATDAWARRTLDATSEHQLRLVSMRRARGGSRLMLSVTHLAVDGGGMGAVGHVLGSHLYGVEPSAPAVAERGIGRALAALRWYHLPVLGRDLAAALLQPMRMRAAAPRERPYARADSREATWRHVVIAKAEVERLKRATADTGASINDLLIAALARASAARSSGGPVVVCYTIDLRRYAGRAALTAANTSSILSAIVPRHAIGNLATTARAVARITARQRSGLAGPAFVVAPYLMGLGTPHALVRRLLPHLHPAVVDLPLNRGLFVSNVGRIDEGLRVFGDDIESVRIIGPNVRDLPVPAIVAFGFRGALHLELFAGPGLAPAALDELQRELVAALELPERVVHARDEAARPTGP